VSETTGVSARESKKWLGKVIMVKERQREGSEAEWGKEM
jgi:hypothetical protein